MFECGVAFYDVDVTTNRWWRSFRHRNAGKPSIRHHGLERGFSHRKIVNRAEEYLVNRRAW